MIGILAGMGPKSTAPFIDKVVTLCQDRYGAKYDLDFPPMMVYACPTPFYIDRPLDHTAMEQAIVAGARKLAATGVDFIAIPCNAAHVYFDSLQAAVAVPVLNMVEETLRRLPADCRRVAVLATPAAVQAGIYQHGLARAGIEFVLQDGWQRDVNRLIAIIKNSADLAEAMTLWAKLAQQLAQETAAVILACTDLNVITDRARHSLTVVDSSLSLAEALVDRYYHIGC